MGDTELKTKVLADTITEEEIHRLTKEGEITAVLEMVLKDKDGKVVERRVQKSESFVLQFLDMLSALMYGSNGLSAWFGRTFFGGYCSITQRYDNMSAMGGVGIPNWGIAVGTGANPAGVTDATLQTWITHGVGAGQLQYGNMASGAPTSDTTASHFTLSRDFSNASGNPITVNEVGLILLNDGGAANYNDYLLCIRDVIGGGFAIPNGQTLTLNYRIICNI